MEKLEGLLQEREELNDITLRHELEALSTHETSLDRREGNLEREQKALEDARTQILARELDADAWDTELRDQEARLAAREWQLVEWQMQELVITQKGMEDLRASRAGDGQRVWSFLGQRPLASALSGEVMWHLKPVSCFPFWTRQGEKYPSWRRLSAAAWRRKAAL
jgi:hypothetical protein